jgi:hypothetical protein
MPRVPQYDGRKVQQAALPNARRQAADTAESLGAGVGQAMANAGEQVARQGVKLFLEQRQLERQKADQVATLAAAKRLDDWKLKRIHDSKSGALVTKGADSFELPETISEEFDGVADEIEAGLSTAEQRLAFQRLRQGERENVLLAIHRHVDGERRRYDEQQYTGYVNNQKLLATANADDERALTTAIKNVEAATRDYAARNGMPTEIADSQVAVAKNEMWESAITNAITGGKDQLARGYFEKAREAGELSGDALTRVESKMKTGVSEIEGERAATKIWAELGPKGDSDPVNIDVMETKARELFRDNVDGLNATIAALRSRKQGVDSGRADRKEALTSQLWGAIANGASEAQVRALPTFLDAPGETRQRIRAHYQDVADRAESRRNAAESRAHAKEQRELTREAREERERELKGWSKYYELSQPESLRSMTPGQILEQLPTLGHAHVNRLLKDRESLQKDDATFSAAKVDNDLFVEVAGAAGLAYAAKPTTPEQKGNLARLRAVVEQEIGKRQLGARRELTYEEKRQTMQSIVDKKVLLRDKGWFYADTETMAALVTHADDETRAYVPVDRIPDKDVEEGLNYLRGAIPPSDARLPSIELKAKYSQRLERAYALRLLGKPRAAIEAALKGQK